MKQFEELKQLISEATEHADKFYNKGNAAAGTRLRKAMQDIKVKANEVRVDVQNIKNQE